MNEKLLTEWKEVKSKIRKILDSNTGGKYQLIDSRDILKEIKLRSELKKSDSSLLNASDRFEIEKE